MTPRKKKPRDISEWYPEELVEVLMHPEDYQEAFVLKIFDELLETRKFPLKEAKAMGKKYLKKQLREFVEENYATAEVLEPPVYAIYSREEVEEAMRQEVKEMLKRKEEFRNNLNGYIDY